MLSILIPTYNYNAFPLVSELKEQADCLGIDYEILVQDDCSDSKLNSANEEITSLKNCSFFSNESNLGRGKNLNSLVAKAKFEWILFLDCDTFPTQKKFIENYLKATANNSIIFGGIVYKNEKPEKEALLRWVYGQKREALSVNDRNRNPAYSALTSNLLIQRNVFLSNQFDESITRYGYEDLVFLSDLKKKGVIVKHIENPTYHLGLETSEQFLNKTKIALENLKFITQNTNLDHSESKILKIYNLLKKLYLTSLISFLFKKTERPITNNLLSSKPSLRLFDLYKLGYYCSIES
ncbi:glycosyltransferase family 2 protein [Flavobacterium pectinovorum]|uniref:glycosyltransferase family 2 protein n=1 Tax=Flavobacterium pectinovorum TaxID=29533 RepID=UPI001FABFA36|nr:glycosyltransferase family 2 protein [Flavobacterium pectinovorum]MCI9845895.1 glycosyltransferase family 2 protein [Flavobacterium pectinovorum]